MRKVDDGKKEKKSKKKIMSFLVATNVVASRPPNADRLERRTLVPISFYDIHAGKYPSADRNKNYI